MEGGTHGSGGIDGRAWQGCRRRRRVRHGDGSWRWLEGTGVNRIAIASIGGIVVNCRDITEQLRRETAIRDSEERLRQALRVSNIGIFDHDHAQPAIYWSPRRREIYGVGPDEPITLERYVELVHPDDREWLAASVADAHDPASDGIWDVSHRIVRPDGSLRWVVNRSQTIFEGEGADRHPVRIIGAAVDDTERRLADGEMRLRGEAIRTSLNAVAISDAEAHLIYVNPAFVRTWNLESDADAIGRTPMDFIDPPAAIGVIEALGRDGSWQGELPAVRPDGSRFEVMASANITRDERGNPINMMASFWDVTEPKRLQAQLLHAQRMESVGRLAGGMAHDFNNLLTVMRGYLDLVLAGLPDGDPSAVDLGEVGHAVDLAADLTGQLLAFSRRQVVQREVVDVNSVVERAGRMLPRLLGEDVQVSLRPGADPWPILADPSQCEQILVNLAVNARDAMPGGGTLTVETATVHVASTEGHDSPNARPGDFVLITVSDTGVGMSDEVRDHIFEPFFTTKEPGRGTGLGLATAYGSVTNDGGWIEVASEPGRGTTFSLYFPRASDDGRERHRTAERPAPGGAETIVLVEDDLSVRRLAATILERQGYLVHVFADGPSAIAAVATMTDPVDLLVSDVVMPIMNGRQVAERLVALRPSMRVLFTSGYTADTLLEHGMATEAAPLLPKPYSAEALAARVRAALDGPAARPHQPTAGLVDNAPEV